MPDPITQSRAFCEKLLELNRTYTRQDIDNISTRVDRDVWKYRGGYYTNPDTGVTTPYCRHEWVQQIAIKRPAVETPAPDQPLIEVGTIKIRSIAEGKRIAQEIIEEAFQTKVKVTISSELSVAKVEQRLTQFKKLTDEYSVANQFQDEIKFKMASTARTYGVVKYVGQRTVEGIRYKVDEINAGHLTDINRGQSQRYSDNGIPALKSKVDADNLEVATLTHEFAHVITNNDLANKYSTDANAKQFWSGIKNINSEYKNELQLMNNNNDFEALNKIYLGRYASTNLDEFVAEGFTEYKLNSAPSKYAVKIGELIDKHFKK